MRLSRRRSKNSEHTGLWVFSSGYHSAPSRPAPHILWPHTKRINNILLKLVALKMQIIVLPKLFYKQKEYNNEFYEINQIASRFDGLLSTEINTVFFSFSVQCEAVGECVIVDCCAYMYVFFMFCSVLSVFWVEIRGDGWGGGGFMQWKTERRKCGGGRGDFYAASSQRRSVCAPTNEKMEWF